MVDKKSYPVEFLFDSGAKISVMSVSDEDILKYINDGTSHVKGIGGSQAIGRAIPCSFTLDCLPQRVFDHAIKPAKIPGEPSLVLLGIDFLSNFNLTLFDWDNNRVLLGDSWVYYVNSNAVPPTEFDISTHLTPAQHKTIGDVIGKYADSVFAHNPKAPKKSSLGEHTINLSTKVPHKDKVRRLPRKWCDATTAQVNEMVKNNIVRESCSPYSSNPVMVTKKDGSKRFCVDYRTLNNNTIKDTYPLPNVEEMVDKFKGSKYFTQLDLAAGYWGIPMHSKDIEKTAFVAPKGKYEFVVMPYGLVNAQATFQRNMDNLVKQMHDEGYKGIDAYVDNIILFSKSFDEHIKTLDRLFYHVDFYSMSLRSDKCEFAKPSMEFLGFIVDGETIRPTPKNVSMIQEFPSPTTRKQLRKFLGMANFNRKFIKNFSEIARPLTDMTSTKIKFDWGPAQQTAFEKLKEGISKAPSLCLADWSKEFHIETDASDTAVGAVLFQLGDNKEQIPLAYFSKNLSDTEKRWSATDKEMYGIICAARKWSPYCSGSVIFHTDHQPLKYMRKQKDPRGKMARWLIELENYDYKIEYIPGKENIQADYLSRISTPNNEVEYESMQEMASVYYQEVILPTLEIIRDHQTKDKHLLDAKKQIIEKGEVSKGIFKSYTNLSVSDNMVWKGDRILLPESLWSHVMREYHGQYHPGAENTVLLIKTRFYWRGMERHIRDFVGKCRTCIQCKVAKKQQSITQIPDSPECRDRLCIDIACMPRSDRGKSYFLQMIDANTKFAATAAISDQQAETIKNVLWPKWFSYFGIPKSLLSDQGPNVDGKVIRDLCKKLNITKIHSSPYHPEGNGSTERSIGSIKTIIRTMCRSRNIPVEDWDLLLDEATLAYNNTVNKSTGFSPFKSMFGKTASLPIDRACQINAGDNQMDPSLVQQNAQFNRQDAQSTYKNRLDKNINTEMFEEGDKVLLKRSFGSYPKLSAKWKEDVNGLPYTVVKRIGPVNYAIRNSKGCEKVYHRNLIKPALERLEPQFVATSGAQSEIPTDTSFRLQLPVHSHTGLEQHYEEIVLPAIDRHAFTDNVFRSDSMPAPVPVTQTRSGRVSVPVIGNRLIDQVSQ